MTIRFKFVEEIFFFGGGGNACLICILINETTISGDGNRTSLCPWVLFIKHGFRVVTTTQPHCELFFPLATRLSDNTAFQTYKDSEI